MPAVGQPSNVPREPVHGEVAVMEEQAAAAPIAGQESGQVVQEQQPPAQPAPMPAQVEGEQQPPAEQNPYEGMQRVVPPEQGGAPLQYGPSEQAFLAILNMPGASPITRDLAARGLRRFKTRQRQVAMRDVYPRFGGTNG
jgi:hypothetical protein